MWKMESKWHTLSARDSNYQKNGEQHHGQLSTLLFVCSVSRFLRSRHGVSVTPSNRLGNAKRNDCGFTTDYILARDI